MARAPACVGCFAGTLCESAFGLRAVLTYSLFQRCILKSFSPFSYCLSG